MQAPVIETARLILRAHRVDDFEALAAMWREPEVVRHISGIPSTREQSWARLLRYAGHWALLGFGYWALEERATGTFIGEVGFADYHREMDPTLDGMPEVGWMIAPQWHGKGYGTEAVDACLSWGDRRFSAGTTFASIITPENLASLRLAVKCGFTRAAQTTYQNDTVLIYTREARTCRT
jgi:RimJ/RimL family protein N-acetyltransferase